MLRTPPSQPAAGRLLVTCAFAITMLVAAVHADDWPEWRGAGRLGVWRESGLVDRIAGEVQVGGHRTRDYITMPPSTVRTWPVT